MPIDSCDKTVSPLSSCNRTATTNESEMGGVRLGCCEADSLLGATAAGAGTLADTHAPLAMQNAMKAVVPSGRGFMVLMRRNHRSSGGSDIVREP
jgi:hypothetical protein